MAAVAATRRAYEASTIVPPGGTKRAAERPPRDNKAPARVLTRDNSVRNSLQALRQ
jgi:hypothetical protein